MNDEIRQISASYLEARLEALWARLRRRVLDTLPQPESGADAEAERERLARERAGHIAAQAEGRGIRLPLKEIVDVHGLDEFCEEALVLLTAPRVDLAFEELLGRLRSHPLRTGIDVDLVLTVLCETLAERLRRRRSLAKLLDAGLVVLEAGPAEAGAPELTQVLRVDERVVRRLLAETEPDDVLPAGLRRPSFSLDELCFDEPFRARIEEIVAHIRRGSRDLRVLLFGPPGTGKSALADAIANTAGLPVSETGSLSDILSRAEKNGALALIDGCERFFARSAEGNTLLPETLAILDRFSGPVIMTTNQRDRLDEALEHRLPFVLAVELPSASVRKAIWEKLLREEIDEDVDLAWLARRLEIPGAVICNAVSVARGRKNPPFDQETLLEAARSQLRERLGRYAERSPTVQRLDDLVLPDDVERQIRELLSAVHARKRVLHDWGFGERMSSGRGMSCLFDGEPGTGKTLTAEIVAAELDLPLFRVNAANVVDKYIGETEKHLTRIFQDAAGSHAVLLFDEADALFGRRVDVRTSNDRFSNMEVNVLLQLIERYEGLVILTTNLKQGIDPAFERRFTFKVSFPFPDEMLRERIWRRLMPAQAPLADDVDFETVAESFELSGGSIRNALLRAAYRAAAEQRPIALMDIAESARAECAAAGRLYRMPSEDLS